jgi:mercuric ion binding protein
MEFNMRKLFYTLLTLFPLAILAAPPRTVTLAVQNMTCPLCPIKVKKSLENVAGVSTVQINFENKTAVVTYDPDMAQIVSLTKATTNAGYPSTVQE